MAWRLPRRKTSRGRQVRLLLHGKAALHESLRQAVLRLREAGHDIEVQVTWEAGDAERFAAALVAPPRPKRHSGTSNCTHARSAFFEFQRSWQMPHVRVRAAFFFVFLGAWALALFSQDEAGDSLDCTDSSAELRWVEIDKAGVRSSFYIANRW